MMKKMMMIFVTSSGNFKFNTMDQIRTNCPNKSKKLRRRRINKGQKKTNPL